MKPEKKQIFHLTNGTLINLEKSLKVGDELGGHLFMVMLILLLE